MLASVRRQGQLTPVVVGRDEGGVFLVDGFKRYRALQQLGAAQIRAQVLERPVRSLKAAIVQLNGRRGLTSIEESWVLQSLHQDDALTQEQIGVLLGRHKSWVCRRLALVERLCDEALENLRLGLISAGICRHLLLLPRGNQPRSAGVRDQAPSELPGDGAVGAVVARTPRARARGRCCGCHCRSSMIVSDRGRGHSRARPRHWRSDCAHSSVKHGWRQRRCHSPPQRPGASKPVNDSARKSNRSTQRSQNCASLSVVPQTTRRFSDR